MRILRMGRAAWLLPVLVLATPMLLPLAGGDQSNPGKTEPQPESPEAASIVNRITAGEKQYNAKLRNTLLVSRHMFSTISRTLNWATFPGKMLTFWAD